MSSQRDWKWTFLGVLAGMVLPGAGCGSSSSSPTDAAAGAADAEATADDEKLVDQDAVLSRATRHAGVGDSVAHAKAVTEALVKEDPTLDVQKTAGQNADAIAAQAQALKGQTCAALTLDHTSGAVTVTVTFPESGCTANGVTVAGKVAMTVAVASGMASVTFVMTGVKVSGHAIDGTVIESTSNGTTYATKVMKLISDGTEYNFDGTQTLDADLKGVTIAGTGTSQATGDKYPTTYTIAALHHLFSGCYADAGTITQAIKGDVLGARGKTSTVTTTTTVTFDAGTPKDGTVDISVKVGTQPAVTKKDQKLPAYGSCPTG